LRRFPTALVGKLLNLDVITLDFRSDHCAVGIYVLRLHTRDRCGMTARAS
jgi:hypothetical protein